MFCKHMSRCCPQMEAWGLLALRIAVGMIFIYQGYGKLLGHPEMAIGMFTGLGFPMPLFWTYFVGLAEVVGGLMVLLGIFSRVAASWLAIIMVVAMATAHRGGPFTGYFLPLVLLGSSLALVGVGAGKLRLVRAECPCPRCLKAGSENCAEDGKGKACSCGKGGMCACGSAKEMKDSCCGGQGMCCADKSADNKK